MAECKIKPTFTALPENYEEPREIELRDEQERFIVNTQKYFESLSAKELSDENSAKSRQFLWNAKMRFGKTLCALELIRRMGVRRTLIITHRPTLKDQWFEDFQKIFKNQLDTSKFGYRLDTESAADRDFKRSKGIWEFDRLEKFANKSDDNTIVFFASMQYLRRSSLVGGDNHSLTKEAILNAPWDMVIIDEAHEGTNTVPGQNVKDYLARPNTLRLELSGTPFNISGNFSSKQIESWDYTQEQGAKSQWDDKHPGVQNPYLTLPRMNILCYNLGSVIDQCEKYLKDGEFKFTEFFRVEEGANNPRAGRFVHEDHVRSFIQKLRKKDDNNYPFSNNEFRRSFSHTLWVVPRVAAANALENLLRDDDVFKEFKIINVAGKNDDDETSDDALQRVKEAIDPKVSTQPAKRSITISCGRLTTGVTVRQWTAVLYMKGSEMTETSTYMQTIFRVQSPYVFTDNNGRKMMKSECYAFDFTPQRALNMVTETAVFNSGIAKRKSDSGKGKKRKDVEKAESMDNIREFLKHCDVVNFDNARLTPVDADKLFDQLNEVYIERIVRNGFDDRRLFNLDEIDNMSGEDRSDLDSLDPDVPAGGDKPGKIGKTPLSLEALDAEQKANLESAKTKVAQYPDYDEWNGALTPGESQMEALYKIETGKSLHPAAPKEDKPNKGKKNPTQKTPEQLLAKQQEKSRKAIIDKLKTVMVRIPLLIYGAEIEEGKDITIDNITNIVDDASWQEFMPKSNDGQLIDKAWFRRYKKYIHSEFFTRAGRRYRALAEEADSFHTEDRISRITEIFKSFRNPDKETVLTPWRVVNMHLSETLGGYCFYDEGFDALNTVEHEEEVNGVKTKMTTVTPRLMPETEVSRACFNNIDERSGDSRSRILEINSKTGLYPLYVAYSLYRPLLEVWKTACSNPESISVEEEQAIWDQVLRENVFVVCKTEMARSITRRTLRGSRRQNNGEYVQVNAVYPQWSIADVKRRHKGSFDSKAKGIMEKARDGKLDLVDILRVDSSIFEQDVLDPSWWEKIDKGSKITLDEKLKSMKKLRFDAVVGNPPYQMTTAKKETENGQKRVANIFHYFQLSSDKLGRYTSLIYPGGRWIHQSGKGVESFGKEQINSPALKMVEYIDDAKYIFENVDLPDGISIVLKDKEKKETGFKYIFNQEGKKKECQMACPGEDLMPLNPLNAEVVNAIKKTSSEYRFSYLNESVLSQKLFGIESDFAEKNPDLVRPYTGEDLFFDKEKEIKLLTNDKAGSAGRAKWFVAPRKLIKSGIEYIDCWKVIVSSAHPAGADKRSNNIEVIDNLSAFGRSRVALKTFETEKEAVNFFKYCQTDLIRFAMLMTDEALTSFAKQVPDIGVYTDENGFIDFSKDINEEVFDLFGISDVALRSYIHDYVVTHSK